MARRGERPPIGLAWVITWPLTALFATLVFLSADRIQHPTGEPAAVPTAAIGGHDWTTQFPLRTAAVDAALHKASLKLPKPVEEERGSGPLRWTHRRYDITLATAEQSQAEAAIEALQGTDPGLAVTAENTAGGTDVRVGLDGLLISTLRFRFADQFTPTPREPRVTVVIGPLGDDLRVARQVVALDGPVVLGVRPFRPFSREVSELGRLFNREVIAQIDAGEGEGSDGAGSATASTDLDAVLASVPQAIGVVWRSGSAQGGSPDQPMLEAIDRHQLLFVGQRTPAAGARATLPPPAVIADGQADAVAAQWGGLADKARSDGDVIALATPNDATLESLTRLLPEWRAAAVEVVPLSALAPPANLSAR